MTMCTCYKFFPLVISYLCFKMLKSNDSVLFCGLCVQETNWQSSHQEEISSDSAAKVSIDHQ